MEKDLVDALSAVFAPMDEERRNQFIRWASDELAGRAVIQQCLTRDGVEYKISNNSPANDKTLIFAMVWDDALRAVVVYTVAFIEDGGQEGVSYFKECLFDIKSTWGSISADALYDEWSLLFAADPEPEPAPAPAAGTNGASAEH